MAPKSNAERMRLYRQRMSEEAKAAAKLKNKAQQQKSRSKWSNKRKKDERAAGSKRKAKWRESQKQKEQTNLSSNGSAFKSQQSYGRAIHKAKSALPNSPNKKRAVVINLAEKFGTPPKADVIIENVIPQLHQMVVEFYESEQISWQCPGRKDYVTVVKDGKKVKLQKKVLLCTVLEAHQQFKTDNPGVKIGKSLFASLRPPHIVPISEKDHNVCCCKYHENFDLLCSGVKGSVDLPDTKTLLNMTVCDPESVKCYLGECTSCNNTVSKLADHFFRNFGSDASFSIYQWNDKQRKEVIEMSASSIKSEWSSQLNMLKRHAYIAKVQLVQRKHLASNLKENEVILHEDFSENFAIKQQNEIMAAHWDQHGATVFTAILTTKTKTYSYAVISDENRHDKFSVLAFNRAILKLASSEGVNIDNVHFFSDGAGSQFKNRFNLSTLVEPSLLHTSTKAVDWSFFATSHGKGAVDGVGGTVKRAVWHRVLRNKVIVNSSEAFADVAKGCCPNINVLHISSSEIEAVRKELTEMWSENSPLPLPDIRSFHFFRGVNSQELEAASISVFMPNYASCFKQMRVYRHKRSIQNDEMNEKETGDEESDDKDDDNNRSDSEDSEQDEAITKEDDQCVLHDEMEESPKRVQEFMQNISEKRYSEHGNTPGDGNCFFWAISGQLGRVGLPSQTHGILRQRLCDFIDDLSATDTEHLSKFVSEQKLVDYVINLRKLGTYADHICVEYMSRMLKLNMKIVTETSEINFGQYKNKETLILGYISEMQHYISLKPLENSILIQVEKYYAVDYVNKFYVGRVLKETETPGKFQMKFLHQISKGGVPHFYWPKSDDYEDVFAKTIFYGPITLQGCGEYTLKEEEMSQIEQQFSILK